MSEKDLENPIREKNDEYIAEDACGLRQETAAPPASKHLPNSPVEGSEETKGCLAYHCTKRLFDIALSTIVLVSLIIPALILSIAICLESPGNPIYVQRRVGHIDKNGEIKTFRMLKFRSMRKNADKHLTGLLHLNEADGPLFKIKEDPRMTKVGRFIRIHSIDEIPQFINCWLGQMSVVGPRPPLPHEVDQYNERAMGRLAVKPGITGYWQVTGRSNTTFEDMIDLDLRYIEERSFLTDLKTIAKTILVVISGKGAC